MTPVKLTITIICTLDVSKNDIIFIKRLIDVKRLSVIVHSYLDKYIYKSNSLKISVLDGNM